MPEVGHAPHSSTTEAMARGQIRALWLLVLKETQTVVTTATAIAILHLRNAHSVYIGAGATVAAFVAKILKRFIRQPRPELSHKKTYGMPSTHSSSIAFFGVYLSLCIWNIKPHPRLLFRAFSRHGDRDDFSPLVRLLLTASVLYGSASVCWSRVRLTYHTPAQVIAGAAVGSIIALLAFWNWQINLATQWAPFAEDVVEDLLLVSLESWQTRSIQPISSSLSALYREITL